MLYYRERGERAAPAIVFLHGGPLSGRMWEPQFERLPDYYCLAPDLPEQGQSARIGPFTLEDAANRVVDLIYEKVPGGRANVVGLSLGGAVALTMLRLAPDCLDHVISSGSAARLSRLWGGVLIISAQLLRLVRPEVLISSGFRQLGLPEKYRAMFYEDMKIGLSPGFTVRTAEALMDMRLPDAATRPLLVVVGGKETIVAKQAARKAVRQIKGARGAMAPGVGHVWNLQAPGLFTAMVRAWITDQPLPAALKPLP